MLREFREFAMRGNVMDMAVGVIIGGAFGKIITSLVNDIIMPPIGLVLGNVDFRNLSVALASAATPDGKPVTLNYGIFINTVIDFIIVAFCIFMAVKGINSLKKKPAPADPTTKNCPECLSNIPIKASRCMYCTSKV